MPNWTETACFDKAGKRRLTRRGLVAGGMAAAGSLSHRAARAAPARELKIGYIFGAQSHIGRGAKAFTDEVARRTGGGWDVVHYAEGALGGELEMLESVTRSEIDLTFISSATLGGFIPECGVLDVPFLFRDNAHAHAMLDGAIGQEYLRLFQRKRIVALAWGENGLRHLTNSVRPVNGPSDLRGLHLRVPQSEVLLRSFQVLGAQPEELAFPALYGALEDGRFDGQENPISVIEASKFSRVQKYLSLTGHVYSAAIFLMSQDAWDDLAQAERAAFVAAAVIGGGESRRAADEAQRDGVQRLQDQGMRVVSRPDREAFDTALAPAAREFARQFGAETIARIKAFPAA